MAGTSRIHRAQAGESAAVAAHGWPYMLALGVMVAGYYSVEMITNYMIPITTRHFTDSAFVISAVVALNRLFGFVVQPYVSWKSDQINTRFGRRRPFLLIGLPSTMVFVMLVGAMPFFFVGDVRQTLPVLGIYFLLNILLQFVVDMNWGSHEPLYADAFKQKMLGRAVIFRSVAISAVTVFMTRVAWRLADKNEFLPYLCAACWVMVSLLIVMFVVRERSVPEPVTKERYNPINHIGLLVSNRDYLKISLLGALGIMENAAYMLFLSLLATRSLGLTKTEMGVAQMWGTICAFGISLPAGYFVDRYGPKRVMCFGYLLFAVNSGLMAWWAHDLPSFLILQIFYAAASALVSLPLTSMIFQYASPTERGKVYGLFQFTRGLAAFVFVLVLGSLVQMSPSTDATPLFADDFKKTAEFVKVIQASQEPVPVLIRANLSAETKALLAKPYEDQAKNALEVKKALAKDLNDMLKRTDLTTAREFESVERSWRTRRLLGKSGESKDLRFVRNRSILRDSFPENLSPNVDFRIGYKMDVLLALAAFFIALSTRRGKYAQTLNEKDESQEHHV